MECISTIEPAFYLLPLVGFTIALFGVLFGGGGGFFFLPVLTLGFKVTTQVAVTTSLVAALPICIVGCWGHYKKGNINVKIGLLLSVFGVIGAFVGAMVGGLIDNKLLRTVFGVYTLLIALYMVVSVLQENRTIHFKRERSRKKRNLKSGLFAFTAGIITGTFGTSGTAAILVSLFNLRIHTKVVIGTSLLVVLTNTLFAIGAHSFVSEIDYKLLGLLTTGSVFGAALGAKLLAKSKISSSGGSIKYIYALVMAVIGLLMIKGGR